MNNVLILGGGGMLGQMVRRVLSRQDNFTVKSTYSEQTSGSLWFNIENGIEELRSLLIHQESFEYIINCIGFISSSIDKNDSKSVRRAILINALFPHELSKLVQEVGGRVIQISSDGVFDKNADICLEDSPHKCADVYGKTKSLGEVNSLNYLNLRCSIIGPSPYLRKGLLEWFLSQPKESKVSGYTNQMWTGITTLQFANLCKLLITDNYFDVVRKETPTHHFCPNQSLSKYDLLQLFKNNFRTDINVIPNTSQDNAVSRILKTKYTSINKAFGHNNSMQQAIKELAIEMRDQ